MPSQGETSPIPGRLADQGPVPGGSTSEHPNSGRSDSALRVDNQAREVQTQTHSGFLFVSYEYHLDSALVKTTQERWLKLQDFILCLVKICFNCKMFDVANWVARLNGEDYPRGRPSHEALSVSSQGALEFSLVTGQPPSLVRDHFSSP